MSSLLSSLFRSTQNAESQISEPVIEPIGDLSMPQLVRQTAEPHVTTFVSTPAEPVVQSESRENATSAAAATVQTPDLSFTGTFLSIVPDGVKTETKTFTNYDEFVKFLERIADNLDDSGVADPSAVPVPDGSEKFLTWLSDTSGACANFTAAVRTLLDSARDGCICHKCHDQRRTKATTGQTTGQTTEQTTGQTTGQTTQNLNSTNSTDASDSKKAKIAAIDAVIEMLSGLSGSTPKRVIAGQPETYKYLPSVGQGLRETFIPLLNSGISTHNPTPPVGMSPTFYAMQYCDITTDADAANLIMTDWVNDALMTRLVNAAGSKVVLIPEARVQLLPGTYVHCKSQKINILGSVFIRRFKKWLTYVSRNDERWKRVIVFGDDDLSYTVCM